MTQVVHFEDILYSFDEVCVVLSVHGGELVRLLYSISMI